MPMPVAAPTDVVALNCFLDTLLFCGAILLLASSIDKKPGGPSFRIITLKVLANFSPGLLQPWVQEMLKRFFATLKELRLLCEMRFVPGFLSKRYHPMRAARMGAPVLGSN